MFSFGAYRNGLLDHNLGQIRENVKQYMKEARAEKQKCKKCSECNEMCD